MRKECEVGGMGQKGWMDMGCGCCCVLFSYGAVASTPVRGGGSSEEWQREATPEEALSTSSFPSTPFAALTCQPLPLASWAFRSWRILEESRWSFAALSSPLRCLGGREIQG